MVYFSKQFPGLNMVYGTTPHTALRGIA